MENRKIRGLQIREVQICKFSRVRVIETYHLIIQFVRLLIENRQKIKNTSVPLPNRSRVQSEYQLFVFITELCENTVQCVLVIDSFFRFQKVGSNIKNTPQNYR